jgi:spore germination protein (amino acid permease)
MTMPVNLLIVPKVLTSYLGNNAWLAIIASLVPGTLIIYIYYSIIKKSLQPFPLLLEEHLGIIPGITLSFIYVFFFILASSLTLRIFVEFIESNVLPGTPISVFIGVMLITAFLGIKSGLTNIARMAELITYVGVPFTFLMIALTLTHNPDFGNLKPFAYMSSKGFASALIFATMPLLNMFPMLTLFHHFQQNSFKPMFQVLLSYILLMSLITISTVVALGGQNSSLFTFPAFVAIRLVSIGDFIQNIDIIFIGVWIMGIFGVLSIWWFMACYTIQQVFNLHDYRFLAAPTALIIGATSIMLSPNILELNLLANRILAPVYYFFLLFIPLIIFLITLFKTPVKQQPEYPESEKSISTAE